MTQDRQTELEVYVHAEPGFDGNYRFSAYACDMSSCGYIPISKVRIPIPEISHEQIIVRHITLLRGERTQVYAEAERKARELSERIAKLEAIGYTPTVPGDLPTTTPE